MNAAKRKQATEEGVDMPANDDNIATQVVQLRSDVHHLQSDVTDIKTELRSQRKETGEKFDKVDQKIETLRKDTDQKFDSVRKDIGEVKDSLSSAKVWALWLYVGLAGSLFYALGHGFKWF